jgi:branched-chain amino acid transport system substrate-binding protein
MLRFNSSRLAPVLVLGLLSAAPVARANDIVIGVPIAQTGPIAFVGVPGLRAMQLAADQANESGMFGSDKVKLIVADDGSDRTQTVTLTNRMIQGDKAIMIVGAAGTTMALAGGAVANDAHIPILSMATSPAVTAVGPYSFHVMDSPNRQVAAGMKYVYDHVKPKTVATIWARDNEGAAAQGKYARQWFDGKATLLPEESVLSSETDFSALATKLAGEAPDVLVITAGSEANAANLVLQMRQGGVKSIIIGTNTMVGKGFLGAAGKAAEGALAPADFLLARGDKLNQDFVAAYTKKYGLPPDNMAALGYTAMQAALHAIKAAGVNPTPDAVRDALAKTRDLPSVTGDGTFAFDANREPDYPMVIVTVKDGAWVLAPQ